MSNWYRFVKRYAWDDEKTPYMTRVADLTQQQAAREIFVYTLFLAILFAVVSLASMAGTRLEPGDPGLVEGLGGIQRSPGSSVVAFYAATIFCAALWLGGSKHPYAATYCGSAPVATFLYILADGFNRELASLDKVVLLLFTMLWGWYALRVTAIARAYPTMPPSAPVEEPDVDSLGVKREEPYVGVLERMREEPPEEPGQTGKK